MANLTTEERLRETLEACEMQQQKLKLCRSIMRENGIGHLYPGVTSEYEEDQRRSMVSGGAETTQVLYSALAVNKIEASKKLTKANNFIKQLMAFVQSKGIAAKELQDYLTNNYQVKYLADDEGNNLQTLSLEDESSPRR